MKSNIKDIVSCIIDGAPVSKSDIAREKGMSLQNLCNRLGGNSRKDMSCANAADIMSFCGYQLVAVPKGSKLPANSYVVELREED